MNYLKADPRPTYRSSKSSNLKASAILSAAAGAAGAGGAGAGGAGADLYYLRTNSKECENVERIDDSAIYIKKKKNAYWLTGGAGTAGGGG